MEFWWWLLQWINNPRRFFLTAWRWPFKKPRGGEGVEKGERLEKGGWRIEEEARKELINITVLYRRQSRWTIIRSYPLTLFSSLTVFLLPCKPFLWQSFHHHQPFDVILSLHFSPSSICLASLRVRITNPFILFKSKSPVCSYQRCIFMFIDCLESCFYLYTIRLGNRSYQAMMRAA